MDEPTDGSAVATAPVGYCTRCGTALADGRCPRCDAESDGLIAEGDGSGSAIAADPGFDPRDLQPGEAVSIPDAPDLPPQPDGTAGASRRRRWLTRVVAAFVALCLVALGVALFSTVRSLHQSQRALAALSEQSRRQDQALAGVAKRLAALQARLDAQRTVAQVVASVKGSVATVLAGPEEGSAFVVASTAGGSTLITNFHVVADVYSNGGRSVRVATGSKSYAGTITKVDKVRDLALVTISATLPPLRFQTVAPDVGESVVVMGSPFGFEGSVSTGVVSAVRDRWVQFSAPVSPGSSGGPLLDANGYVIGITQAKVVAAGAEGLSFAIPDGKICGPFISCQEVQP